MVACCRSSVSSSSICILSNSMYKRQLNLHTSAPKTDELDSDQLWLKIKAEAFCNSQQEPALSNYYQTLILNFDSIESALAHQLAVKLSLTEALSAETLTPIFTSAFGEDIEVKSAIRADLRAARERDPACSNYLDCLLNYKGFLAVQSHRAANWCWKRGRAQMALLIQGRASVVFGVDIHPGARIGRGILIDHGTGVVIGETAVVGDGVTIYHGVTLGGRGKEGEGERRHPTVEDGVFVGAGACVLGNVRVGRGAKIGAGAVVVKDVPAEATAVGNPARFIGGKAR